eukprot:7382316-Prymnesium_polylepis.1
MEDLTEEEQMLLAEDTVAMQLPAVDEDAALDLEALAREDEDIRRRTAQALAQRDNERGDWAATAELDAGWCEEQQARLQQMMAEAEVQALAEAEVEAAELQRMLA